MYHKLLLGSAVAVVISAFLPWISTPLVSPSGIEGDGVITLILAVISAAVYLFTKNSIKVHSVSAIIAGAISLLVVIYAFSNIGDLTEDNMFGDAVSAGFGLYLTGLGSIGLIISGILGLREK